MFCLVQVLSLEREIMKIKLHDDLFDFRIGTQYFRLNDFAFEIDFGFL
jgi:hypothetical protein